MRTQAARILGLLAALSAAPALAQDPADPIGEALEAARPAETLPQPFAAPTPPAKPTHVNETGKSPEAPPSVSDLAYDTRIRASMASAQGFQGPLDGGWTLAAPDGDLFGFQLADRGTGTVEGAWRDLRRPGAIAGSGLVDRIERSGSDVVMAFGARTLTLRPAGDGRWTGELDDGGARRAVTLRRKP